VTKCFDDEENALIYEYSYDGNEVNVFCSKDLIQLELRELHDIWQIYSHVNRALQLDVSRN
jgi:hypothetical protein